MHQSVRGVYGIRGEAHVHQEAGRAATWRVEFSLPGFGQFKKRFPSEQSAKIAASRANSVLHMIRAGHLPTPAGATREEVCEFVLSGGKPPERSAPAPAKTPEPTSEARTANTAGLIDSFLSAGHGVRADSTCGTEKVHMGHLRRFLEARRLLNSAPCLIDVATIKAYRVDRMTSVGPVTVNKEVASVVALLSHGVEKHLLATNPIVGLPRVKITAKPPEFQTLDEIERLLREGVYSPEEERRLRRARILYTSEIDDLLRLAVGRPIEVPLQIAAFTGARRGEVARVTWADVFSSNEIALQSRKQSTKVEWTPRRVPMHPELERSLQTHRVRTGGHGYLCPGHRKGTHISPKTLHDWLTVLVAGTPFAGIGWHTLRHSLASNMARAGTDPRVINKIMGHTGDEMARRYMHLFPQQRQDAIEAAWSMAAPRTAS